MTLRIRSSALVCLASAALAVPLVGIGVAVLRAQVRDVVRPAMGTGVISGTVVTDEAAGRPVRRATVTVFISGDAKTNRSTATDDSGRFAFDSLPAGAFTLTVSKPSYVATYYGAKRPGSTVGVPIAVADGQRVSNINVRLLRGGVITGTILDQAGRPVPSVSVGVQKLTVSPSGERDLASVSGPLPSVQRSIPSDDRGVYRVFGLPPGEYVVSLQPPRVANPILEQAGVELREPTVAELQWAERQLRGASTGPAAAVPAPPQPGRATAFAQVFYPGTIDAAAATPVTVGPGQEQSGIDLRMQVVTTARIEGRVTDSNGQPALGVQVTLLPRSSSAAAAADAMVRFEVGLIAGAAARTGADGGFSFSGVQPGAYTLTARPAAGRGAPAVAPAGIWAEADVDVSGDDVAGIALTLMAGMSVAGRLAVDGAAPAADARVTMRLSVAQNAGSGQPMSLPLALSGADTPFSFTGVVPGRYRIGGTWGTGPSNTSWTLTSAMLNGKDVADAVFEVKPGEGVSGLVVTFTDTPAQVSGTLFDAQNHPTSDLSIMLFTADRTLWFQGSRRLRAPLRAASNGGFTFTNVVAGDYYLAALADFEPADWYTGAFLDQVAATAVKITVAQGEKKVQNLKLAGGWLVR